MGRLRPCLALRRKEIEGEMAVGCHAGWSLAGAARLRQAVFMVGHEREGDHCLAQYGQKALLGLIRTVMESINLQQAAPDVTDILLYNIAPPCNWPGDRNNVSSGFPVCLSLKFTL